MPVINFQRAIDLISKAYQTATIKRNYTSPFFYIVGSGISAESIPLANEMVKSFASELNLNINDIMGNIQKKYSELFEEVYYEPTERRDYLYDIMESATITEANFMLAHLLIKKTNLSNLVVTTNFDNLLARALNLFGAEPLVFDHPNSIERINTSVKDKIQIVHVHGSYRFYDCCNLDYEIQDRASTYRTYYSSVFNYLMNVLSESSPIIIGYGGWNDVVLKAIKQRLESSVGYHYYWFCYDKNALLEIDAELKKSPYIFFVVNDNKVVKQENFSDYEHILKNEHREISNLPATQVFDKLKTSLTTEDLELFNDPLIFFKKQLDKLFPKNIQSSFYSFDKVRTILDNAISANLPGNIDLTNDSYKINKFKGDIQTLGRQGKYNEIMTRINSAFFLNNRIDKLQEEVKIDVLAYLLSLGNNLRKISQNHFAYSLFSKIISTTDKKNVKLREIKSNAWYEKAKLDLDLFGAEKALEAHNKLITEFLHDKTLTCMENVARSYYAQGYIHDTKEDYTSALTPYHNLIEKFQNNDDGSLKINVANAYLCLGRNYFRIGKNQNTDNEKKGYFDKALQVLNKVVNDYEDDERSEFLKVVSDAIKLENTINKHVHLPKKNTNR
jgi:tetratricopeptide (TPR) repeat protein